MSLLTKPSSLPPLPAKLSDALVVENTQPNMTRNHGVISIRFDAPSGRGSEYPRDHFSLRVFGAANGYLTVAGSLSSNVVGMPSECTDRMRVTFPIDLLRPLLLGLEDAGRHLARHEQEVERGAAVRGALSAATHNGWRWF